MGTSTVNPDLLRPRLAANGRYLDAQFVGEIAPGERTGHFLDLLVGSRRNDLAAILPGARPEVENCVGCLHNVTIMLDHQNRVTQVAQIVQYFDQEMRIPAVQSDGWLIQHVKRSHQARAQRSGQLNALGFAARQRGRQPVERQILQPYFIQEPQALADLQQQPVGNACFLVRQSKRFKELRRGFDRHAADIADILAVDLHLPRLDAQAGSMAGGTHGISPIAAQEYADMKLVFLPLQIVKETAHSRKTPFAFNQQSLMFAIQFVPGHIQRNVRLVERSASGR